MLDCGRQSGTGTGFLSWSTSVFRRSQWSRGLRRGSAAARWPGLECSNPAGGMDVVCCQVDVSATGRADHSSRRVLPSVVCLSVI